MTSQHLPEVSLGKHKAHQQGEVHCQIDYYNYTGKMISVIHRNGFVTTIHSKIGPGATNGKFIITQSAKVGGGCQISRTVNQLEDNDAELGLYTMWQNDLTANEREYSLTYTLTTEQINRPNGFYLDKLDIVLSFAHRNDLPSHPRTHAMVKQLTNNQFIEGDSIQHTVRVVDGSATFGERYVNICGKVLVVHPISDRLYPDGVYITTHKAGRVIATERYELEDPDCGVRFYPTMAAARDLGDEVKRKEEEFKTLQADYKLREAQLIAEQERIKLDLQDEARRKDAQYKEEERRRDRESKLTDVQAKATMDSYTRATSAYDDARSRELSRRKDFYETEALNRKSTLDISKSVPTIFTIVGNLFK